MAAPAAHAHHPCAPWLTSDDVIETDGVRLELEDVVPVGRRSIDVTVGDAVTFALEKNVVYVKDKDGKEHKLRVTKKTTAS